MKFLTNKQKSVKEIDLTGRNTQFLEYNKQFCKRIIKSHIFFLDVLQRQVKESDPQDHIDIFYRNPHRSLQ